MFNLVLAVSRISLVRCPKIGVAEASEVAGIFQTVVFVVKNKPLLSIYRFFSSKVLSTTSYEKFF